MPAPDRPHQLKRTQARNFDVLNAAVAGSAFDPHLRFLNYGYTPLEGEAAVGPRLGPLFPNPEAARLLFQVIGDVDLDGLDVAEVGCGRGGNLWLVGRHHHPARLVGLDLAPTSVALVAERVPGAEAVLGDAEHLPFATASLDVVLSVETSCAYPDLDAFLVEVTRVLRPGGWFLHADLLPASVGEAAVDALVAAAFEAVTRRDITANVIAARHAGAERQGAVFAGAGPERAAETDLVAEYLGVAGSGFGRALADGSRRYRLARLRRTTAPVPTGPLLDGPTAAAAAAGAAETAALLDPGRHAGAGAAAP